MDYRGLTAQEVEEREAEGKVNKAYKDEVKSYGQIIREHVFTYFNAINVFLALLIILSGKWLNMTFIGVVFVNTLIGIAQEFKVKRSIDKLRIINAQKCHVYRDGKLVTIPIHELVLDDIVSISAGEQIAADLTVLDTSYIEMNEAILTGESDAVEKKRGDEILAGTFVASGTAVAKVIRVGADVYSAKLTQKAKHGHRASSEMMDTIQSIIKVLSIIIIPVGLLLFRSQYFANRDVSTAIVKTVAGVVGMIPEGLVLLTSLSFVIGVGRLAKKNALVQQMEAIEALARIDVLCLDKTGTITTGELQVCDYIPLDDNDCEKEIGACVHATTDNNATQEALQAYFKDPGDIHVQSLVPFSSARKYSSYTLDDGRTFKIGAPDYLLDDRFDKQVQSYMKKGYRVLAVILQKEKAIPAGLIVLKDVIKPDARDTFAFFEKEDVRLCIVSGDHPDTVARVCHLAGLKHIAAIDATTLPDDPDELAEIVDQHNVFGRVKPEQKELIVKAYQRKGYVTGMVGDGVNDVLAIKEADCGIAMANGADAAKSAAHIVLLDSRFSSMQAIVQEGRTIIANIERVSSLYLTKTIYSTLLSILFSIIGRSYPFTPFQLSIISGFAIGYPSFLITLEKNVHVASQGFLNHVLKTALPCALTIVTFVAGILAVVTGLGLSEKIFLSYSYIVTIFISFIVLAKVCLPFNKYRLFIFILCASPVAFVINFLSDYLSIAPLTSHVMIYIIPILFLSLVVEELYSNGIHWCMKHHVFRSLKNHVNKYLKIPKYNK